MSIVSNRGSLIFYPKTTTGKELALASCLDQLYIFLGQQNTFAVLRATFFVDAKDSTAYQLWREKIETTRNTELLPVISVIAQPPMNGCISLEVDYIELSGQCNVELQTLGEFKYWRLTTPNSKEVIISNCCGFSSNTKENAKSAFESLNSILKHEGLKYSDIVRQWNYVGNIVHESDGKQNYQIFNDVRSVYYSDTEWDNGFPAATGIGMSAPGIVLDINIVKSEREVQIVPISNPHQIDAHVYTDKVLVGDAIEEVDHRTSPKFERAKSMYDKETGIVYISGTASIYGEKTEGIGDVAKQTEITIDNITTLVDAKQQNVMGKVTGFGKGTFVKLRAYVKHEKDFETVASIVTKMYPNTPCNVVIADVCREALLVEIEGDYQFQLSPETHKQNDTQRSL